MSVRYLQLALEKYLRVILQRIKGMTHLGTLVHNSFQICNKGSFIGSSALLINSWISFMIVHKILLKVLTLKYLTLRIQQQKEL